MQSRKFTTDEPVKAWYTPAFDDSSWTTGKAPFGHAVAIATNTDWKTPKIWLRRKVNVTAPIPKDLEILAFHDEDTEFYINGVLAAKSTG